VTATNYVDNGEPWLLCGEKIVTGLRPTPARLFVAESGVCWRFFEPPTFGDTIERGHQKMKQKKNLISICCNKHNSVKKILFTT